MEDWTLEEFAAALRAEIERDGVPVNIPDEELVWAFLQPLIAARRRHLEAYAALGPPANRATEAINKLTETIRRGEEMDYQLVEIQSLPESAPVCGDS